MKTLALLLCILPGPTYAAVITAITCPTPAYYVSMLSGIQTYLMGTQNYVPAARAGIPRMIDTIITSNGCNIDHSPGYVVLDRADYDGIMYVEIQNKFYSGWMNADDFKKMYLDGTPQ